MSVAAAMLFLALAICLEIAGTTSMKLSQGFSQLYPSLLILVFYAASLGALNMALVRIDVGVAYAIWSGVGTAMIAVIGIVVFKEEVSVVKVISLSLIIMGVIGLNLSPGVHK